MESPKCPKCGFVMCEQFDETEGPNGFTYATGNGKFKCREESGREGFTSMTSPLFGEPVRANEPRYTEAFMEFWLISTMRGSKLAAFKAWQKIQPTSGLIPAMVDAMLNWQLSAQWQDETKQPHVSTWLNRRGWEEIVPRKPEPKHIHSERCWDFGFCPMEKV